MVSLIYKGTIFSVSPLLPPKFLQQLDGTYNPFHQKHWVPLFKIFKICPVQIWTRFNCVDQNSIYIAPKILNLCQTLPYASTLHHKNSCKFLKCLDPSGISSSTWWAHCSTVEDIQLTESSSVTVAIGAVRISPSFSFMATPSLINA